MRTVGITQFLEPVEEVIVLHTIVMGGNGSFPAAGKFTHRNHTHGEMNSTAKISQYHHRNHHHNQSTERILPGKLNPLPPASLSIQIQPEKKKQEQGHRSTSGSEEAAFSRLKPQ